MESEIKIINLDFDDLNEDVPYNYTGIIQWSASIKQWYFEGKLHRVDGPAFESIYGTKAWYLNGIKYSQEEWFEMLSDEDKEKAIWNLR
jgi:hypothetical protein